MSGGGILDALNPLAPINSIVDTGRDIAHGNFGDATRDALGTVVAPGDILGRGVVLKPTQDAVGRANSSIENATHTGVHSPANDPKTPPGSKDGTNALSALTQEMWDDYVKRWVPEENLFIDWATNNKTIRDAETRSGALAGAAAAQQPGMLKRQLQGLGVTPDAQQQDEITRQSALSGKLSEISAVNNTRDVIAQQQRTALSGGGGRPSVASRITQIPVGPGGA